MLQLHYEYYVMFFFNPYSWMHLHRGCQNIILYFIYDFTIIENG